MRTYYFFKLLLVTWCIGECLSYTSRRKLRVHPSSVEFSPEATIPQTVEFGPPTTTQVRFPMEMEKATRRSRRRHGEKERTSQWSSWSTIPSREQGRKRARDGRPARTPDSAEFDKDPLKPESNRPRKFWPHADKAIVVFPCQEAAMKCEFVKEDTEHPYHCKWTTLEDPKSVEF